MKKTIYILFIGLLGIAACTSQKSLVSEPPFTVDSPSLQYWSGGMERSGRGMNFAARWNPFDPEAIVVDSLFVRGRIMKLEVLETETGFKLEASYKDAQTGPTDIIMHADSTKEVGNQLPRPLPDIRKFPFKLKPDEAVMSYLVKSDGKKYYYKIRGVKEKPTTLYPGRQKN